MRALSQAERIEVDWTSGGVTEAFEVPATSGITFLTQVQVFQNSICLIEESFNKPFITVGRSKKSDIVLPDSHISRRHFHISIENQKIFIFVEPGKRALRVKGKSVKAAELDPDNAIQLGPYRLKVRVSAVENPTPAGDEFRYQIVFDGKLKKGQAAAGVAKNLKRALELDGPQTASLFSGKPAVIKQDLDLKDAIKLKKVIEQWGAIVEVQAALQNIAPQQTPTNGTPIEFRHRGTDGTAPGINADAPESAKIDGKPQNGKSVTPLVDGPQTVLASAKSAGPAAAQADDDEDEDDCEATFSLKEKLSAAGDCRKRPQNRQIQAERIVEVFKFRENAVIDVRYLNRSESYFIETNRKRFRLARKNGAGQSYLYFDDRFTGTTRPARSGAVSITQLQVRENLYRKRKGLYRLPIEDAGEVFINDGCHDYLIRSTFPGLRPAVPESRPVKKLSWKHGAVSVAAHVLLLLVLTFLPLSGSKQAPEPETRFVQVDPHLMDKIQQKDKPVVVKLPPPKPKKTRPAAEPVRREKPLKKKAVARKKPPVRKKSARAARKALNTAKKRASSKSSRKTRKSIASKHPQAGGGYGKGNTSNRNVKQVGVLGLLGDSASGSVKTAVADVTNLDAVRTSNSGQAKFKVGGIKGKLGTSDISVSGGDVVATKGNSQVLRSYGAGGSGSVAALEKGSVGQKQVRGMVQARLNRSVRIKGGMSREAVKRVIQQHLDEITYCYETALIANPSIKGKITMEWKIRMSGAVGEVRIKSSTVRSPEIYDCIKSAIKTWRFPQPVGNEVVVSYPFIFDVVGF